MTCNQPIEYHYRESEVKKLTAAGKNFDALKVALNDPPVDSKDENAKVLLIMYIYILNNARLTEA